MSLKHKICTYSSKVHDKISNNINSTRNTHYAKYTLYQMLQVSELTSMTMYWTHYCEAHNFSQYNFFFNKDHCNFTQIMPHLIILLNNIGIIWVLHIFFVKCNHSVENVQH